ncbi:type I-E CRISPR-associated protein Cse1/CasA [Microbacterium sp.]|uniref:type I-E CRISPR-associated protein Cse1/CasA n=1 Tax=Microbacterium sp. TaxID=51671 RepID=UPI00263659B9|nr:type I-E CRISPR-associated protein Cse1/CasA [Microbacterium sp.]
MSGSSPGRFHLVDEEWITVRYLDGSSRDISIHTAFHDAAAIREIEGEVPTQSFAILRLLLAILSRAIETDPARASAVEWSDLWADGLPLPSVDTYLDTWRDRFWLLHPERPFFQVADLATAKGEFRDTSVLILDLPSNNRLFTTRSGSDSLALEFGEAARWLVNTQAFDPSGIKSGDPRDPRVKGGKGYPIGVAWSGHLGGVMLEGGSLAQTLLLNLVLPSEAYEAGIESNPATDIPVWERPDPDTPLDRELRPTGPVALQTWQSRRIRLVADGDRVTACLVCNGDALTPQNQHRHETMTAWRFSEPQTKKAGFPTYMAREHLPEHSFWRGIGALLPQRPKIDKAGRDVSRPPAVLSAVTNRREDGAIAPSDRIRLRAVGVVYGSQSSVVSDVIDDRLNMTVALFDGQRADLAACAENAVHLAEDGVRALRQLAQNLALAGGGDGAGASAAAEAEAYDALDRHYRTWLATLDESTDAVTAMSEWRGRADDVLRRLGRSLVASASTAAWSGREVRTRTGSMYLTTPLAESWFLGALRKTLGDGELTTEETPA